MKYNLKLRLHYGKSSESKKWKLLASILADNQLITPLKSHQIATACPSG